MSVEFKCPHLQPFVDALLAEGATVLRAETGWSNCRANLVLSRGPALATARARWILPEGVELWSNEDGHYSIENGLVCSHCRMGVSWPRPERQAAERSVGRKGATGAVARLCPELRVLLEAELAAGNCVADTGPGLQGADSVIVVLGSAFRAQPKVLPPGVEYREINDPHWWKAEYFHPATRHVLACRF